MGSTAATSRAVGTVVALYRYPVKSLQGMRVESVRLGRGWIEGDRRRALIDGVSGRLMSAKRHRRLLEAAADDESITLPDGRRISYEDPETDEVLSAWLGRPVRLETVAPTTAVAYEMTFEPPNDEAEFVEIPSPPGTFLDLSAAHMMTTATLDHCARRYPPLDWDVRRFRPNLVVGGAEAAFAEDLWCGHRLSVGQAVLGAVQPTVRCAMPLRAQPGLDRERALPRARRTAQQPPRHLPRRRSSG
jgi:hypothetical protein